MRIIAGSRTQRRRCGVGHAFLGWFLILVAGMSIPGIAGAQVRWEDYRGDSRNGADYVAPAPGVTTKPTFGNFNNDTSINSLRVVSADIANAVRVGTSTQINFLDTEHHLCDERDAPLGDRTGAGCQYQTMGRVTYARIRFPVGGTYTLSVAHDDSVEVNLATDYTNTSYRSVSYNVPVGGLQGWTNGPTDFASVGSFTAVAGSCALVRVYWSNQGGLNFNRLAWNGPGTGGTTVIPTSAFSDPGATAPANCTATITGSARSIALNKFLGSQRANASDQFIVEIATAASGGLLRQAITAGSGVGQQASTGAYVLTSSASGTYYLRESMAAGSVSTLLAYDTSIACTRNSTTFAATAVSSTASERVWSVSMPASSTPNSQVVCSITNTARPTVTLNKTVASRAVPADQFQVQIASAASGGTVFASAATTGAATSAGTGAYFATVGTTYHLRDSMAAGSTSSIASYSPSIQCTRNGVAFTPAGSVPNWNVTPATGDQIACTITNAARPTVTVLKTSLGAAGTFAFTGGNGIANHSITTITPGTPVAGPRHLLTTTGVVTTITEDPMPAGFTLHGITCTGLGTGEATVTLGTRTVSLNAAATALGNAIECTFTNRRIEADLSVTKTNTPLAGPVDQANDVLLSGSQTIYEIVVSNAGPDAANGAILSDPPPTGLTCNAVTCSNPTGGAVCPAVSVPVLQGSGVTINTLPASSSLTFRLTCTVN